MSWIANALGLWGQKMMEKVTFYAWLLGQFKEEEAMYEVDIPTDPQELGTEQYDSKDSLGMLIAPSVERDFVRLQETFIKSVKNTRNTHNMFGKPCIPLSPLHLLVLFSASNLYRRGWRSHWTKFLQTSEDLGYGPT